MHLSSDMMGGGGRLRQAKLPEVGLLAVAMLVCSRVAECADT